MGFEELKDNLFEVLAGGEFTMDFPSCATTPSGTVFVRGPVRHAAQFQDHPSGKHLLDGLQPAYIGINTTESAASRSSWEPTSIWADLYMGCGRRPHGFLRMEADIPRLLLQLSRSATSATAISATSPRSAMPSRSRTARASFDGAGLPLTHRSVLTLRANAGHVNYRYDSDVLFADDTDHSRFSFFGLRAGIARNTLDKFLYPRAARNCTSRRSMSRARQIPAYDAKRFVGAKAASGSEGVFVGQVLRRAGLQLVLVRLERRCRVTNHPRSGPSPPR